MRRHPEGFWIYMNGSTKQFHFILELLSFLYLCDEGLILKNATIRTLRQD